VPLYIPDDTPLVSDKPEVIVCVGYPASGKSSFVKRYLSKYTYINQDTLKTKEKCVLACKKALDRHESVVIDNTNMEASTRSIYVTLAHEAHVPVRCFDFGNNEELCQHNNQYRAIHKTEEKRPVISSMVFRLMKNRYQTPTKKERFDEIKKINFKFEGSDSDKEAWEKWWF
jgi:bifunctional polynucleotide phosphatase/kinase